MSKKDLIARQKVSPQMVGHAKKMRREMTLHENKLWQRLRAGRLEGFHFRRQQIIGHFIVDFYCHASGVVVELDGGGHLHHEEYDRDRDEYLCGLGLKVLRFFNSQVDCEMDTVLEVILHNCRSGL